MTRFLSKVLLLGLVCVICFPNSRVHGEDVIVSVQSQSQEEMDSLTSAIDGAVGSARVTLGAIEATMSRVVNAETYVQTAATSLPTLTLLNDVAFDETQELWTFHYKTMRVDSTSSLNNYQRVLYFSKQNAVTGDLSNPCMPVGVDDALCLQSLQSKYVLPQGSLVAGGDTISNSGSCDPQNPVPACDVAITVTDQPYSLKQDIEIQIPHSVIRDHMAKTDEITSPMYGTQTRRTFGIGMLFLTSGNNMLMFDVFDIVENSNAQYALAKRNSYSMARHVSFWTQSAANNPDLRIATIEYLLVKGQRLLEIAPSINGRKINSTECMIMQHRLDSMSDSACLTQHPLCKPVVYESGGASSADVEVWATYVMPIPLWVKEESIRINTLLTTNDTSTGQRVLSTLNFKTTNVLTPSCAQAVPVQFDPTQYVKTVLYKGHALVAHPLTKAFEVHNDTSLGVTEALMTLVLRPDDTPQALDYFSKYTDEQLTLDELYMSHSLDETQLPDSVSNTGTGIGGGRSELALDPALLTSCPRETVQYYSSLTFTCITTKDWGLQGAELRVSSADTNFVYEAMKDGNKAADIAWLESNIFGSSDPALATAFWDSVKATIPLDRQAYSKVYWVWPLYHWPNRAPMGLEDKTLISLSWSIAKANSLPTRRLLAASESKAELLPVIGKSVKVGKIRKNVAFHLNKASRPANMLSSEFSKYNSIMKSLTHTPETRHTLKTIKTLHAKPRGNRRHEVSVFK